MKSRNIYHGISQVLSGMLFNPWVKGCVLIKRSWFSPPRMNRHRCIPTTHLKCQTVARVNRFKTKYARKLWQDHPDIVSSSQRCFTSRLHQNNPQLLPIRLLERPLPLRSSSSACHRHTRWHLAVTGAPVLVSVSSRWRHRRCVPLHAGGPRLGEQHSLVAHAVQLHTDYDATVAWTKIGAVWSEYGIQDSFRKLNDILQKIMPVSCTRLFRKF